MSVCVLPMLLVCLFVCLFPATPWKSLSVVLCLSLIYILVLPSQLPSPFPCCFPPRQEKEQNDEHEKTMRGCSSVGRASDRHAAGAGSILRCGKGFFSQSQLSMQTLLQCPSIQPQCTFACSIICAHVEDPKHWQPYLCLETRKYCTIR